MKNKRFIILVVILAICGIGYYYYLSHKPAPSVEDVTEIAEVDELLNKNVEVGYPATPREVLKLYSRYICCMYTEELTDEQLEKLGKNVQNLYDEELIEHNPDLAYIERLMSEVSDYREKDRIIIQGNVCDSDKIIYREIDGREGAIGTISFFIKEGTSEFARTNQQFLLRKDEDGKWRILSFEQVATVE